MVPEFQCPLDFREVTTGQWSLQEAVTIGSRG